MQNFPAGHETAGSVIPVPVQRYPTGHPLHYATVLAPILSLYVPVGHFVLAPLVQYCPLGHNRPYLPSVGFGTAAPPLQMYPSRQTPFGAANPNPKQYLVAGHEVGVELPSGQ